MRTDRQGEGEPRPETLLRVAEQGAGWVRRRRPLLATALALAAVLVAIAWGVQRQQTQRTTHAAARFAAGLHIYEDGVVDEPAAAAPAAAAAAAPTAAAPAAAAAAAAAPAAAAAAAPAAAAAATDTPATGAGATADAAPERDPSVPHFATAAARWQAAREHFAAAAAALGVRGMGGAPALMVGNTDLELGNLDAAAERFAALAKELPPAAPLYFLAVERLAYVHEQRGDADAALAVLAVLAGDERRFYADYAQSHTARLLLAKHDPEAARARLEHLESAFPNSSILDEARERLAALGPAPEPAAAPARATP